MGHITRWTNTVKCMPPDSHDNYFAGRLAFICGFATPSVMIAALLVTVSGCSPDPKQLIEALENHNTPPEISRGRHFARPLFDEHYDWAEQDRVYGAIARLVSHAERAWPEIVEHLDDSRYCITFKVLDSAVNLTVGDVCSTIISDHLSEAYYRHVAPLGSQMAFFKLRMPDVMRRSDAKMWCQSQSSKPLYELQIEMCEWAIPVLEDLGNLDISDAGRREAVAAIRAEIESLRHYKKATLPAGLSKRGPDMYVLYTRHAADEIRHRLRAKPSSPTVDR